MEPEHDVDSELNVKEEIEDSLEPLEEYDHNTVVHNYVDIKDEFGSNSENQTFDLKPVEEKSAFNNEEDSISRSSCEAKQPNVDEDKDTSGEEMKQKDHKCSICNKVFVQKRSLVQHRRIHKGMENIKCTICGEKFVQKSALTTHMKLHPEIRILKCNICSKQFKKMEILNKHLKCHAGIRDFQCSICGRGFVQKENLNTHMKTHNNIRDYKCSVCDKKFNHKLTLVRHLKMHEGIKDCKCPICNKKFVRKDNLALHMKIHDVSRENEEIKPTCSICNKKYLNKRSLVRHMKKHEGTRKEGFAFCKIKCESNSELDESVETHGDNTTERNSVPQSTEFILGL